MKVIELKTRKQVNEVNPNVSENEARILRIQMSLRRINEIYEDLKAGTTSKPKHLRVVK